MSEEPRDYITGEDHGDQQQGPSAPTFTQRVDAAHAIRSAPVLTDAECAALARTLFALPPNVLPRPEILALLRTVAYWSEQFDSLIRAMERTLAQMVEMEQERDALLALLAAAGDQAEQIAAARDAARAARDAARAALDRVARQAVRRHV